MDEEGMRIVGDAHASGSEGVLNRKQNAVLQYADAMTKSVKVPDEIFQELKDNFSEKEVVEITATVAAYNCNWGDNNAKNHYVSGKQKTTYASL
ncbi:hypothetical protein DTO207G8_4032 [Paecilomyces variotii]|nr:hypothetical protein DTO169E5_7734 [Paecilomyces variotii]KAJ9253608.1 hypothetical protein DTO207G8_4032 [Paecilomyces variotii]